MTFHKIGFGFSSEPGCIHTERTRGRHTGRHIRGHTPSTHAHTPRTPQPRREPRNETEQDAPSRRGLVRKRKHEKHSRCYRIAQQSRGAPRVTILAPGHHRLRSTSRSPHRIADRPHRPPPRATNHSHTHQAPRTRAARLPPAPLAPPAHAHRHAHTHPSTRDTASVPERTDDTRRPLLPSARPSSQWGPAHGPTPYPDLSQESRPKPQGLEPFGKTDAHPSSPRSGSGATAL